MNISELTRDALVKVFCYTDQQALKALKRTNSHFLTLARDAFKLLGYERGLFCAPGQLAEAKSFHNITQLMLNEVPTYEQVEQIVGAKYAEELHYLMIKAPSTEGCPAMPDGALEKICTLPKLQELVLCDMKMAQTFQAFAKLPPALTLGNVSGLDVACLTHLQYLSISSSQEQNKKIFQCDPAKYTQLHTLFCDTNSLTRGAGQRRDQECAFLEKFPVLKKIMYLPGAPHLAHVPGKPCSLRDAHHIMTTFKNDLLVLQDMTGGTILSVFANAVAYTFQLEKGIQICWDQRFVHEERCEPETRKKYLEFLSSGRSFSPEILEKPLAYACVSADSAIVRQLLTSGASVNPKKPFRQSPLEWAVVGFCCIVAEDIKKQYLEVIAILLFAGANPNVENQSMNPLSRAIFCRSEELVRKLLNAPTAADPNLENQKEIDLFENNRMLRSYTPLDALYLAFDRAIEKAEQSEIGKMLLEKGAKYKQFNIE